MILNHLWGLYAHPRTEWQTIDKRHEGIGQSLSHILLISLIPSVCGYISAAHIGWSVGVGDPVMLTQQSALIMSAAMYVALIGGIFVFAYLALWMAQTFGAKPTYTQALELASYTATPLFMVGIAALYPELWFIMMAGLVGLAYSVYLLYSGVPIMMHIPEEQGFIYSSSLVTCGLVLLVSIMVSAVIFWSMGFGPTYIS